MSLILDGTNGLSDIDGSAATPAIRGTDANTGIFFPAADTIAFSEGGVEAMRIDSSGNVGIGVTSPSFPLHVQANSSGYALTLKGRSTGGNENWLQWTNNAGTVQAGMYATSDNLVFTTTSSSTEGMRLTSTGLGIGTTAPKIELQVESSGGIQAVGSGEIALRYNAYYDGADRYIQGSNKASSVVLDSNANILFYNTNTASSSANSTITGWGERARIDSSGNLLVGKTATSLSTVGCQFEAAGVGVFTVNSDNVFYINRLGNDGSLIRFYQASTEEGSISVSGTTVSYNGGHLSRWAQTTTAKDNSLVKGTVLSNLDAMNVYTDAEGNPVANEQLNKVKVSDVEGDANVAGVFVSWTHDDAHNVDEINMAMTGDMIIRIARGVTVVRGDLLMSAGDGTAKPQEDDIVRSKTVAKVTSNHVTCTYADGSYCVPCVLMAC
jgi:hypothetical protein